MSENRPLTKERTYEDGEGISVVLDNVLSAVEGLKADINKLSEESDKWIEIKNHLTGTTTDDLLILHDWTFVKVRESIDKWFPVGKEEEGVKND